MFTSCMEIRHTSVTYTYSTYTKIYKLLIMFLYGFGSQTFVVLFVVAVNTYQRQTVFNYSKLIEITK